MAGPCARGGADQAGGWTRQRDGTGLNEAARLRARRRLAMHVANGWAVGRVWVARAFVRERVAIACARGPGRGGGIEGLGRARGGACTGEQAGAAPARRRHACELVRAGMARRWRALLRTSMGGGRGLQGEERGR